MPKFYVQFEDAPEWAPEAPADSYTVVEAVHIADAADAADRLYGSGYSAVFNEPAWFALVARGEHQGEELGRVATGRAIVAALDLEAPEISSR